MVVRFPDMLNHAYAMRFELEHGWQITDEDNTEFFLIRDQNHIERILRTSTGIFISAWHSYLQID